MTFTISLTRVLATVGALVVFAGESAALLWLLDTLFATGQPFTVNRVGLLMGSLWLLVVLFQRPVSAVPVESTEVSQ